MTAPLQNPEKEVVTLDTRRAGTATTVARSLTILIAGALALALAAPGAGAHDDGTTSHLWLQHIKPMKEPGTINDATNPVDWTKLKGVPNGFADGTDNGIELAGAGLKKVGTLFAIDWTKVQRLVKNGCSKGQSIQSIDEQGVAVCTQGPRALSMTIGTTGNMCNADCTEGFLNLTPGTWSISATIQAEQEIGGPDDIAVDCHLDAGGLSDASRYAAKSDDGVVLSMQLIATLSQNLHASVNCRDHDVGEVEGMSLSIIALRLD